ncbi:MULTISPECIES: hypothetical protein [Streptomyces]|uniref:hypothetical protein n=1 Tax=Streptomyces TaxID=1883 RepID=UPI0005BE0BED|nr:MULTISPECIES: hypothetical protein [Streptomyces]MDP9953109.1 hypothetical protein [Streptomyces sp. DSM 41269]
MPDTSPTPADRPADQLRAALGRATELHERFEGSTCGTCADADGQAAAWPCETASALAVARQLLGTTETEGGEDTIGLCGYCGVPRETHHHGYVSTAAALAAAPHHITAAPPAPADRAAVLREAADLLAELGTPIFGERSEHERGLMYGAERLRRLAGEAAAGAHHPEQAQPEVVQCGAQVFTIGWHYAHDWIPQPGMTPVRCPGTTPAVPAAPEETQ